MAGHHTTNPIIANGGSSEQPFEGLSDLHSAVLKYLKHGYAPVPVAPKSKVPAIKSWPEFECTPDNVIENFDANSNVALHLGKSGLVDIDLDAPQAIKLAPHFLPHTSCIFGRKSKPASHFVYSVTGGEKRTGFKATVGGESTMLVEFRAGTNLTTFPPSVHETGEQIEFQSGSAGTPSMIAASELRRAVVRLACATLFLSVWPKKAGSRQDIALALSGGLARSGVPQDQAQNLVLRVASAAGDEEAEKRAGAVAETYAKVKSNEPVTGWPQLAKLLGNGGPYVVDTCRQWLGCSGNDVGVRKPASDFLVSANQLAKLDIPKREDLVAPWMKAGSLILVFSAPKVGKTWFSLQLANDLVSGTEFLKWPVPTARRVLYVDGEMSLGELKERVDSMVADHTDRFTLLPSQRLYDAGERALNLCDSVDQEWLDQAIEACGAEVVILDTLSSLTSGRDENDNSSPQLERLIRWLNRLRYKGLAVVLVHHAGHNKNHPRGASKIEGMVDTVVKLIAATDGTSGEFTISFPRLRGPSPVPAVLTVGLKDHGDMMSLEPTGKPVPDHANTILTHLKSGEIKTQKELANKIGLSPAHVSGLMTKLRAAGLVNKKGLGLTQKGKEQALATSEFSGSPEVQSAA